MTVHVPCCICKNTKEELIYEATDYITKEVFYIIRCNVCGLIYVNPRPTTNKLANYYPQTHQASDPALYEKLDAPPRIKLVESLFDGTPRRILDIGCGKGLLLAGLQKKGWKVAGIELSETSAQIAIKAGITIYTLPIEECSLEPESFDVITLYHSLEHMINPSKTLKTVHKLLHHEGLVVVEVPNIGSWYAKIFGTNWFHLDVPRHLYHFNKQTLRRIFKECGFLVVKEDTHHLMYDVVGTIQSTLNKFLHKKNLLNNFSTGEVTLKQLWNEKNRVRNLVALAISELAISIGFPILILTELILSRWVDGGTLRFVARPL